MIYHWINFYGFTFDIDLLYNEKFKKILDDKWFQTYKNDTRFTSSNGQVFSDFKLHFLYHITKKE